MKKLQCSVANDTGRNKGGMNHLGREECWWTEMVMGVFIMTLP